MSLRAGAIAFVFQHWQFFLGALVFGLIAWGVLRMVNGLAAGGRAKADQSQSAALDAEMQRIRDELAKRDG